MINFLRGAVSELKNVSWPTEKETFKLTTITIIFVVICAILFYFSDALLEILFGFLYR